jgi:transmembrane sensor
MSGARRKAAVWVARRLDRQAHNDQDFGAWRAADPANGAAFDRLWATAQDAALTEAMALSVQRRSARRSGWAPIAALASGLAACVVALAVAWPQLQLMTVDPVVVQTAPGQIRTVALALQGDAGRRHPAGGADRRASSRGPAGQRRSLLRRRP